MYFSFLVSEFQFLSLNYVYRYSEPWSIDVQY